MNLIDRDLIPFLNRLTDETPEGWVRYRRMADYDDVMRMPVIDARPERYCYIARVDDISFKCMSCGQPFKYGRYIPSTGFKYCPGCGRKVKEEIG